MFKGYYIYRCNTAFRTIYLKVSVIDGKPDPNISTFAPLDQQINSNIMYTGNGYMPCNGYVPCQVSWVTSVKER